MADKPVVTWGTKADHLKGLRKQAEYTLACIVDVEGMADLEQEAGRLRTQIEGYAGQIDKAKQAVTAAESNLRVAEAQTLKAEQHAERETRRLADAIHTLAEQYVKSEAEAKAKAQTLTVELTATHAALVGQHQKDIAALERTKAKLEADIKALRERVGAL